MSDFLWMWNSRMKWRDRCERFKFSMIDRSGQQAKHRHRGDPFNSFFSHLLQSCQLVRQAGQLMDRWEKLQNTSSCRHLEGRPIQNSSIWWPDRRNYVLLCHHVLQCRHLANRCIWSRMCGVNCMQCNLTKGESKDIYNVTKDFNFKVMLFLNFILFWE